MTAPPAWLARWAPVVAFQRRCNAITVPATWTSWWRSIPVNAAEGGDAYSQHLLALAADAVPTAANWARFMEAARAQGLVVVDERYTRRPHVHLQAYGRGTMNYAVDALRPYLGGAARPAASA